MDMEFSTGTTVPTMRDSGLITKLKDKGHFGMLKEMFTKENLRTIWPMGTESTPTSTDPNTRVSSKTTFRKVMEKKNG